MRRRRLGIFAVIGATLAALAVGSVGVLSASAQPEPKVAICHATASETNPYVFEEPNQSAVDGQGPGDHFAEHKGPIFPDTAGDPPKWGDIIPPVEGFHDGLNWTTEGQAILANNCEIPEPPPTTAPPTTAPPTTQAAPPVTQAAPPVTQAAPPPPPPGPPVRVPAPVAAVPRVTG